jgi:hypothetical protein
MAEAQNSDEALCRLVSGSFDPFNALGVRGFVEVEKLQAYPIYCNSVNFRLQSETQVLSTQELGHHKYYITLR